MCSPRRIFSLSAVVVFAMLLAMTGSVAILAACGDGPATTREPDDPVVALVNGQEVRRSEVDKVRAAARLNGQKDAEQEAFDRAIDDELVRQEAGRSGLRVSESEVEKRLTATADRLGGEAGLTAALDEASMSKDQLRAVLATGALREVVRDARFPDAAASDEAVRRFYKRNLGTLFTTPATVKLNALLARNAGIASNALARLRAGRPFSEVARQFSIDPGLRDSGGEFGWIQLAALPDPLARAIEQLPVGEISEPIEGPGGAWIVEVLERRPEEVTPLAEVRSDIERLLTAEIREAALAKWLANERKAATITITTP